MKKSFLVVYEGSDIDELWSTPFGFFKELNNIDNLLVEEYKVKDFENMPWKDLIQKSESFQNILFFVCGYKPKFDLGLVFFRLRSRSKILIDFGDEPQTQHANSLRKYLCDLIITSDLRCNIHYKKHGFNSLWLPHWADPLVYKKLSNTSKRKLTIVTTAGDRPLSGEMKKNFKDQFVNERHSPELNIYNGSNSLYNSTLIVWQYANNDEITRRIFEAAAAGCMVITNRISKGTGLHKLFKENKDIVFFDNRTDMLLKAEYYLRNQDLAQEISVNIHNKVISNHMIKNRVDRLMKKNSKHSSASLSNKLSTVLSYQFWFSLVRCIKWYFF
jgi:hypothetical protein